MSVHRPGRRGPCAAPPASPTLAWSPGRRRWIRVAWHRAPLRPAHVSVLRSVCGARFGLSLVVLLFQTTPGLRRPACRSGRGCAEPRGGRTSQVSFVRASLSCAGREFHGNESIIHVKCRVLNGHTHGTPRRRPGEAAGPAARPCGRWPGVPRLGLHRARAPGVMRIAVVARLNDDARVSSRAPLAVRCRAG